MKFNEEFSFHLFIAAICSHTSTRHFECLHLTKPYPYGRFRALSTPKKKIPKHKPFVLTVLFWVPWHAWPCFVDMVDVRRGF